MNKKIKLAMVAGTVATVMAPLATLACGTKVSYMPIETLNFGLVTDGGDVDDKSFNQQGFEALKVIRNATDVKAYYNTPSTHSASDISKGYQALKQQNVILAPGFYHVDAINQYHKNVKSNRKHFILVDGVVASENVASVLFDTRYAAFQAGYLAAKYLEASGDTTPTLGTFGGGNFPGVTDFMVGFVYGAQYYNDTRAVGKNAVAFATLSSDEAYTNTGFASGGGTASANALMGDKTDAGRNADVVFPVAGPQTADVMTAIGANTRIKVIGVDVNQANIYPDANKKYFITSVEKKVKEAFVSVAADKTNFGKTISGGLDKNWVGISDNTASGHGWDAVTDAASLYTAASGLTKANIDTAIAGFATKTWTEALTLLKSMTAHTEKE